MNEIVILPRTIPEQLLYATVQIQAISPNGHVSSGTGFFFVYALNDTKKIEMILTNKHVVKSCSKLILRFHEGLQTVDNKMEPQKESFTIEVENPSNIWVPHPNEDVDLGALLFRPIRDHVTSLLNKNVFAIMFEDKIIKDDKMLAEDTSVYEEVLMAGYPIGLSDSQNNFPLLRKGVTASHPALDFDNTSIGVVDIACFPGSSGSPIAIYNDGINIDKAGNRNISTKFVFLGLLSSGPVYSSEGKIEIKEIPTTSGTPISKNIQMIHIGYYIKAKEILKLCDHIRTILPLED